MHHHKFGDVNNIWRNNNVMAEWSKNPDGYIWKLFVDMSYIMNYMNTVRGWFDPDLKPMNILVSGDWRNFKTTSFIKIDNGVILSRDEIISRLRHCTDNITRQSFSFIGTFVK